MSPLSKLTETRGFITIKRVPDNFEIKNAFAQRQQQARSALDDYKDPKTHQFRTMNSECDLKRAEFQTATKPDPLDNPHHISDYDKLPRFWADKERQISLKREIAKGLENKAQMVLTHKKLPLRHIPLAQNLKAKHIKKEKSLFLQKDQWESQVKTLARTINDHKIVGKPPIVKHFKAMKPEHLEQQFDGSPSPFKAI